MFDNFKDSQFVAYSLLTNSIKNNKISHAYLIDGNNNEHAFDFVMSLVKVILCKYHYTNFDKCGSCNLCNRIDSGNYPEVKIISSDSLVIKKEQLLELQSDFSKISVEGDYRIYIIKDCDKMNKQASNSLLKFLEEPEEGIIAILLTNNINKVLKTIVSRCQLITLAKDRHFNSDSTLKNFAYSFCSSQEEIDNFLEDQSKKDMIEAIIKFILYYEENGLDIMIYLKKMWYNNFLTRDDNIMAVFLMVLFFVRSALIVDALPLENFIFSSVVNGTIRLPKANILSSELRESSETISTLFSSTTAHPMLAEPRSKPSILLAMVLILLVTTNMQLIY